MLVAAGDGRILFGGRPSFLDGYVPIPDLAPDQVCLAVAASRTSPLVDDFATAPGATAEVTAECGNYEMWQLGSDAVSKRGVHQDRTRTGWPLRDGLRRQMGCDK